MRQYYLDDFDITDYIQINYNISEQKSIIGQDNIRISSFDITLSNINDIFTPHSPQSIFYGRNVYESKFKIMENNIELYIGRVKKVLSEPSSDISKLTIASYIDDIIDRTCIFLYDNITPAEAFYRIMVYYGLLDYIDMHSYYYSKSIQETQGLYVDIIFYINSTSSISDVLQQLASLSGADVYFTQGKIGFWVWQDLDLSSGVAHNLPTRFISGKPQFWNDTNNIRNQYSYTITISSSDYELFDTYVGADSRRIWGERSYNNINLNNSQNIQSVSATALTDAGSNKILRAQNEQHYCKFSLITGDYNYPFSLNSIFQFEDDINDYLGSKIETAIWEVISQKISNEYTEITAVQIN